MKKILIFLTMLGLFVPSFIYADAVSFRVGYFFPKAGSDLWEIEFENMDFTKTDYMGSSFGFVYEYFISPQLSLVFGVDGYNRKKVGAYMDLIGDEVDGEAFAFDYGEGFGISHVFSVSNTPIQLSLKLAPMGRKGKIIPYVGGGVGLYVWSVRLQGDMVDFSPFEEFYDVDLDEFVIGYPIYTVDAREDSKFGLGFQAFGGFMVPVANRISVEAEFKYNFLKAKWSEDNYGFQGFDTFDLSGYQISVGINYWF